MIYYLTVFQEMSGLLILFLFLFLLLSQNFYQSILYYASPLDAQSEGVMLAGRNLFFSLSVHQYYKAENRWPKSWKMLANILFKWTNYAKLCKQFHILYVDLITKAYFAILTYTFICKLYTISFSFLPFY